MTDLRSTVRQASNRSSAVAVNNQNDPTTVVAHPKYLAEFGSLLPDHVDVTSFIHLAQNALRRDDKLMDVARQNPASFIHALREAARLGHEPGTDAYYLTPRYGKDPGVLGIEGYKGVIERMYRAGAVSTVIVKVVREHDTFRYVPGVHDRPQHPADWFGNRGKVIGAYAYAVMRDGSVSNVVIVDQERIDRAKAASQGADSRFSPWSTDYAAMVQKTAAHDLEPWVPTSSEYRRAELRDQAAVQREAAAATPPPAEPPLVVDAEPTADPDTGEITEPDDDGGWPEPAPIPNGEHDA